MKPKKITFIFVLLAFFHLNCKSQKIVDAYNSENLRIVPISEHSFVHVSYLHTTDYGKVPCNGLVYIRNRQAIVFDTPTNREASGELLKWLVENKKSEVTAIVINHYHIDCLGGLEAFQESGVSSYANYHTIDLARAGRAAVPDFGFDTEKELDVGGDKIINGYYGEAHSADNIVSYIPREKLLFGGCMIKSLNAGKGNLNDANLADWSKTVSKIKAQYSDLEIVVPGHGAYGNIELLDYTIELFKIDKNE